ncbi:hypothetical protein [Micromonospora sp. NPDC092111]|uniref:hypothetical protein n=1 Tax=Micromonospora sp. NPDC092111 TaxID=3364289 RepID=UPI0037FECC0F
MNSARFHAPLRSLVGLAVASLVIAAIIMLAPHPAAPQQAWQPPASYAVVSTVALDDGRTLRLWTGSSGWYVESLASGRHEAAVGATSGGAEHTVSETLGGLVGYLPTRDARTVVVGAPAGVRADVHAQMFLVPATAVDAVDDTVLLTSLDATGRTLARTTVEITGRE